MLRVFPGWSIWPGPRRRCFDAFGGTEEHPQLWIWRDAADAGRWWSPHFSNILPIIFWQCRMMWWLWIILYYTILYYTILYYAILHFIISYHAYHIISYHFVSYHIILYCVILHSFHYITLNYIYTSGFRRNQVYASWKLDKASIYIHLGQLRITFPSPFCVAGVGRSNITWF